MRGLAPWSVLTLGGFLLGGSGGALFAEDALASTRAQWAKLDRDGRVLALMRLGAEASPAVLEQCKAWLLDKDPVVRGHVARLAAACGAKESLRQRAEALLGAYLQRAMDERARREKQEFDEVCRRHGRKVPPPDQMTAGAGWKDPWDERNRPLPSETKEERAHMKEVVGAIEDLPGDALRPALARIFGEHHDPEILLRVVACWRKRKEWSALPAMADLARIQQFGRAVGGGAIIGVEQFETMRLKWDVHKDRLWWSRPEYVPRATRPLCETASEITGGLIRSAREFDAWMLANEEVLRAHGVRLAADFRARAAGTQPKPG